MQPIQESLKPLFLGATDALAGLVDAAARVGAAVGKTILSATALIKDGRGGELFSVGLDLAIQKAMDVLGRGFSGAVAFLGTALPPIFDALTAKLHDNKFWEGVKSLFDAIASKISAAFQFGPDLNGARQANEDAAAASFAAAEALFAKSGKVDFGKVFADSMKAGAAAASDAVNGPTSDGLIKARENWDKLAESASRTADQLREATIVPAAPSIVAPLAPDPINAFTARALAPAQLVASITRIGGNGGPGLVSKSEGEQQKMNFSLSKLVELSKKTVAAIAAQNHVPLWQ